MQINTPSCTEAHSVSVKIGGEEGGEYDKACRDGSYAGIEK